MEAKARTKLKLEASGRITPREVLEAYKETGLEPKSQFYFDGCAACGLGAMAAVDGLFRSAEERKLEQEVVLEMLERRMGEHADRYMAGFDIGFMGIKSTGDSEWTRKGNHDGRRVCRFVFREE